MRRLVMFTHSDSARVSRRTAFGCLLTSSIWARLAPAAETPSPTLSKSALDLKNVTAAEASYRGKNAVRLAEVNPGSDISLGLVKGLEFQDGTIDLWVAGTPAAGALEGARGFIGVAFRVRPDASAYEYIYLRPTNGRADDQVRRNHSAQYAAHPDYPWQRLRKEAPEKYESYVDLEPGAWTHMRVAVAGTTAKLFVHGAEQPCLVVNDMKLGKSSGGVALWIGPGTDGYFADCKVTR